MIQHYPTHNVGIISNTSYSPSVLAMEYIKKTLESDGIRPLVFNLDDLIAGKVTSEIVFNVYYGEIGDGGIVSGLLDAQGIRYVGNSQYSCSLMLNKVVAKELFLQERLNTASYWYASDAKKSNDELLKGIESVTTYPLLVKPATGAASENIVLITDSECLTGFIGKNRSIIDTGYYFFERFLKGIEVSAGYIHAIAKDLPIVEISLKGEQYQSNKVKFNPGLKENIIPARLPHNVYQEAQRIVKSLSHTFASTAFIRADMIYVEDEEKLYLLEVNTNPGLLETSLLPLMAQHAGYSKGTLFSKLMDQALLKDM
jgi:D-alanine-D-alanine ligase